MVLYQNLRGWTEENHQQVRTCNLPTRDLSPGPPEYKEGVLIAEPRCCIICFVCCAHYCGLEGTLYSARKAIVQRWGLQIQCDLTDAGQVLFLIQENLADKMLTKSIPSAVTCLCVEQCFPTFPALQIPTKIISCILIRM